MFLNKNKAFTLAEVLIVLAIVGIIAAITIPSLINAYNRKMLETRFRKTDAILTQAMRMASNELGVDSFEVYNNVPLEEREATTEMLNDVWEKQFKGATKHYRKDIIAYINNGRDYRSWGRLPVADFRGPSGFNYADLMYDTVNKSYALILPDGSMISSPTFPDTVTMKIVFDTNGPWVGPNKLGYDVFVYLNNVHSNYNACGPLSSGTYQTFGCYKQAHINQNPYDKSITWWSSLYKDKSWWENLKNNSSK